MSKTVDERVVSMQFDNQHFEKNVQTSLKTIDKLKNSLNMTGAAKGLEDVNTAARNVDMSSLSNAAHTVGLRFSALQTIATTALVNITNSAVNAGKRIVSALTIDPVKMGFNEYELKMGSIQTIMSSTGESLETVNQYLGELNEYSDKTIYSFQDMTSNIGKFTNAGVNLKDSVAAIKGVSNVAAVSGANAGEASRAMYNFAQALSSGYVKLIDWKSIENANMATVEFKEHLLDAAVAQGTLTKTSDGMYKTLKGTTISATKGFNDSLQEQWMTSEVLIGTLKEYSDETTEIGKKAAAAATEVKTVSQLFDTLKESAQSGWAQTWEIIVGDFEEAKKLLAKVNDVVGGFIGSTADARNELLENWKVLGGRDDLIEALGNAFKALMSVVKPIKEAFREIFPPMTAEKLVGFTKGLKDLTAKMTLSDGASDKLKRTFKGLFAVIDIVKELFGAIVKAGSSLFGVVGDLGGGVLGLTASFGDWLVSLSESIKSSKIFHKVLQGVADIIKIAFKGISAFAGFIKDRIVSPGLEVLQTLLGKISEGMSGANSAAASMRDGVVKAFDSMGSALQQCTIFKVISSLWNGLVKIATSIASVVGSLLGGFFSKLGSGDFQGILDFITGLISGGLGLALIKLVQDLGDAFGGIGEIFEGFGDCLSAFQAKLKADALLSIGKAVALLAASLLVLSLIDPEKMGAAIGAITMLFTELLAAMSVVTKLNKGKGLFGITTAIMGISAGMLLLATAIKIMSTMSWSEMGVGLISMAVGLGAMVAAIHLLPEAKVNKAASAIKKLSSAMLILAVAIKIMSTMSWSEMGVGLITMVVGLGAMVAAVNLLPANKVGSAASAIMKLSSAMLILSVAIKIMSTISWSELAVGLVGMVAGLAAMVGAVHLLPKDTSVKALGMVTIATSMLILAGALKIMATMSWEEVAKGMVTLATSLFILSGGVTVMENTISGSIAMLIAVGALSALVPVLIILGSMSWGSIAKGLITIAGAFTIIGVAGAVLGGMAPIILSLAGAIALIGVAVLAAGVGMLAFGAGLTAVVAALITLAGAMGTIAVGIVAVVEGIVVGIIKGIGNGIVAICDVIANSVTAIGRALKALILVLCEIIVECIPAIVDTILKVVVALIDSLATYTPQIVAGLFNFIIGILDGIADHIPDFIVSLVNIVLSIFTGAIEALKTVDPDVLIKGILSIGLMAGVMAALAAVAALTPGAMLGVLGMAAVVAELSVLLAAFGALAQIPGLKWLIDEGGELLQSIGTAIGKMIGGLLGGIAQGMTSALPQIGTDLSNFMINAQPFIDGAAKINPSMMEGVKSLVGIIMSLTGANIVESLTSWLTGGSSLIKFGEELAAFAPHFKTYADTVSGINPAVVVASATAAQALAEMSNCIPNSGGIVSWFSGDNSLSAFADELPVLGEGLKGFSDKVSGINPETVLAAVDAAKGLVDLTNYIPNSGGVASWFAGDNSVSKFSEDLACLGKGIKGFSDNIVGINSENVVAAANAGRALAEMTQCIPNSSGVSSWFAGENSVSKFSNDIVSLGKGLKGFSEQTSGVSPEQVTAAANSAKALAEMTQHIPNSGGVVSWFAGDNSISKFASELPKLGKGLKGFSTSVEGINAENVSASANAAKALAEMTQYVPKEGGIKSWFTGETSIATFADKLPKLGEGLKGFSTSVEGINAENLTAASNAAKAIAEMTGNTLGNVDKIPVLATNLQTLGSSMKKCFANVGSITPESISATQNTIKVIAEMVKIDGGKAKSIADALDSITKSIKNLSKIPKNATSEFSNALKKMSETGTSAMLNAFKDIYPEMKTAGKESIDSFIAGIESKNSTIKTACTSLITSCVEAMSGSKSKFTSAGSDLVDGFASGISANSYKAEAKARAMAKAAAKAAEDALDINSPSKVFRAIGYSVPEGFAMGIDKLSGMASDSATTMATDSVNNVRDTIARIADVINSDIDAQPTIRPVLDLSEVRSGAKSIGGLFGRNSSVGVLTNVGTISSAMKNYNRNGDTLELVSQISKLRKELSDVERATYNINGITYDDGSSISEAVKTLIRAAKVERRL